MGAGPALSHAKLSRISVDPNGAAGVNTITKLWAAPAATSAAVLGWPVT
jgi:hypothetical protein